jgi:hypothetical protein
MAQHDYVMDVRVPEGAQPGQSMLVDAPTGQQVHVEIPAYATPGSTIAVSVPGAGPPPGPAAAGVRKPHPCGLFRCAPPNPCVRARARSQGFGAGGDDDLARAIQASLQESGGAPAAAPVPVAPAPVVFADAGAGASSSGDQVAAATREAIQMGFPEDQVARVQASSAFTSTAVRACSTALSFPGVPVNQFCVGRCRC